MFYSDHQPPHFHAVYGEHEVLIEVETLALLRGSLPRRAQALVIEWAVLHRDELRENWQLAQAGQAPHAIEPLD